MTFLCQICWAHKSGGSEVGWGRGMEGKIPQIGLVPTNCGAVRMELHLPGVEGHGLSVAQSRGNSVMSWQLRCSSIQNLDFFFLIWTRYHAFSTSKLHGYWKWNGFGIAQLEHYQKCRRHCQWNWAATKWDTGALSECAGRTNGNRGALLPVSHWHSAQSDSPLSSATGPPLQARWCSDTKCNTDIAGAWNAKILKCPKTLREKRKGLRLEMRCSVEKLDNWLNGWSAKYGLVSDNVSSSRDTQSLRWLIYPCWGSMAPCWYCTSPIASYKCSSMSFSSVQFSRVYRQSFRASYLLLLYEALVRHLGNLLHDFRLILWNLKVAVSPPQKKAQNKQ